MFSFSQDKLDALKYQMVKYTATKGKVKQYSLKNQGKLYDMVNGLEYLEMVSNPTKEVFYATYYGEEDLVKPFFDYDKIVPISSKKELLKIKKKEMTRILDKIVREFDEEGEEIIVAVSDGSRETKKGYKISFHFIINSNVYCKVKDLRKIAYAYECDDKVYKGNRILRFSNQYKDMSVLKKPKLYCFKFEDDLEPQKIETDLSMFLINKTNIQTYEHKSLLPELEIVKTKKKYKRGKNNFSPIKDDFDYIPHKNQITELKKLFRDFTAEYIEDYERWRNIGFMLSSFSTHKSMLDLWIDVSKKSPKYEDEAEDECRKAWNYFIHNKPTNRLTMGSLIREHRDILTYVKLELVDKKLSRKNKKILKEKLLQINKEKIDNVKLKGLFPIFKPKNKIKYQKLHKPIPYNALEGLDNLKQIKKLNISSKFLTKTDLTPIDDIKEQLDNNKYIFIKSPTGSGKTCLIQHLTQDKNAISIVSRRSLATFHYKNLDCIYNHYDIKEDHNYTIGKVYQLDSLYEKGYNQKLHDKMLKEGRNPQDFQHYLRRNIWNFNLDDIEIYQDDYILILDEFNSLINHIFSNLRNMRTKRLEITQNLIKVIENASKVLCFDADLSTSTLQWVYENINTQKEKPLVIINEPKVKRKTPIVFNKDYNKMILKMKKDIENDIKFFACSDRCRQFFKDIIMGLLEKDDTLEEKEKENILEQMDNKDEEKIPFIKTDKLVIYSGYEDPNEINTDDWEDKWVFTTPTIIYGVDYNGKETHKIYSFNWGGTISALGINQQIGRIRQPISMDIFIEEKGVGIFWSWEQFLETFTYLKQNHLILDELCVKDIDKDFLDRLNRLNQRFTYKHLFLSSYIEYHLKNLLGGKGYTNIKVDEEELDNIEKERFTDKALIKYLKERNVERTEELQLLVDRFNFNDLTKVLKDIGLDLEEVYYNDTQLREFLNIGLIRDKYSMKDIKDSQINKVLSPYYKLQLFRRVMNVIGIENIYDWTEEKMIECCENDMRITNLELISEIKLSYKIKVFKDQQITKLFSKMCNQVLPTFTIPKRFYYKGKDYGNTNKKERCSGFYISEFIKPLFNPLKNTDALFID